MAALPVGAGTRRVGGRILDEPPLNAEEQAAARSFKAAMDRRGASIILTYVPTHGRSAPGAAGSPSGWGCPRRGHARSVFTEDDDHLDESSAVAWSEAFVRALEPVLP